MVSACRSLAPLVVVLAAVGAPASGQTQPAFEETIEVELLEVDVLVSDGDRRPVPGLGREDFRVRVEGKRVEVTHFAAMAGGEPVSVDGGAPVPRPPRTADDRAHLVIYVDHAHLQPGELGDAVAAVIGFLRRALVPGDRVMVAEANQNLRIVQRFTALPELAVAALEGMRPQAPRSRAVGEVVELLAEMERKVQEGTDLMARNRDFGPSDLKTRIDNFTVRNYQQLERTTHQLHRLLPALAGLPGQRVLVYVGGTPPTEAGRTLVAAWRSAFGAGSRYRMERDAFGTTPGSGFDTLDAVGGPVTEIDAERLFGTVAEAANDQGVVIYALDTGGLRAGRGFIAGQDTPGIRQGGGAQGSAHDLARRLGNAQSLRVMAEDTGGRATINTRAFDDALARLGDDLRHRYVLAFPPPAGRGEERGGGERLRIEVRLKGDKRRFDVRSRRSVKRRSADYAAADRAVSALLVGEAANPLDVAVVAGPPRDGEDATWLVPLTVSVPIDRLELASDADALTGRISLYLTSGDLLRGAAEVKKASVPLRLDRRAVTGEPGQRLEYPVELPVAAGSAAVAVTVRDDHRLLSGTARTVIPPPEG